MAAHGVKALCRVAGEAGPGGIREDGGCLETDEISNAALGAMHAAERQRVEHTGFQIPKIAFGI